MKPFFNAFVLFSLFLFSAVAGLAQESEPVVVDEVIAQVNDGVITLSRLRRETNDLIETLVSQGQSRDEAKKQVESRQGELIASMVNNELLAQKGKELGIEQDVEGQINQRFLEIMKQENLKTLDALYKRMQASNLNPEDIRATLREQFMQEGVLGREVDQKLYHGSTAKELKEYFEKNKPKFIKPGSVAISEIFISLAGITEEAAAAKAKQIVMRARAGEDFAKLAMEFSERPDVAQTKGKIGKFSMDEINDFVKNAIKNLKAGQVSDPQKIDEGFEIIRVDELQEDSKEAVFDEDAVRTRITLERRGDERKKYLATLRQEATLRINESYRPLVAPILFEEERKNASEKKTEPESESAKQSQPSEKPKKEQRSGKRKIWPF
jgi:peptidyl-prolyl cis-trans isomerase SurA